MWFGFVFVGGFGQKNKSEKRMSLTRKDVIQLLYPNLPLDKVSVNAYGDYNNNDSGVKASSNEMSRGKSSSSSGRRNKVVYSSDESEGEEELEGENSDGDSVGELDVDTLLYESITGNTSGGRKSKFAGSENDSDSEQDTEPQCVDNALYPVVDGGDTVRLNSEDEVVKEITDSVLLKTMKQLGTEVRGHSTTVRFGRL